MLATGPLPPALDDERGTVLPQAAIGLDYGLSDALVMEPALRGRIHVEDEEVFTSGTSTDDGVLNDALRTIAATPGKNLSHGVRHLSRDLGGPHQRLLDRPVARGTLEKREKRVLLLFHQNAYPERDIRTRVEVQPRA
ncbi:MAG TPA: GPP34 family phosphoprotein [Rhodanobacteraceae bacterium]|nr:GPP34 family phosphoprotein [Rhodanobacteraceae bacterium]